METEEKFVMISNLLCEPARARMLWNLLDGRAFTATELAAAADISATSASNHLAKLLAAGLLKVETQGRHRYYSFARPEIAYAVESLANLAAGDDTAAAKQNAVNKNTSGITYCRTCYDHLAGLIGVKITEAFERRDYLRKSGAAYSVTEKGWQWLAEIEIFESDFARRRRPLTRQCLDWSERRPHLAGGLGAMFLEKALQRKLFEKVQFSRELIVTPKGRTELLDKLDVPIHFTK